MNNLTQQEAFTKAFSLQAENKMCKLFRVCKDNWVVQLIESPNH